MARRSRGAVEEMAGNATIVEKTVTTTVQQPPSNGAAHAAPAPFEEYPVREPDINVFFMKPPFNSAETRFEEFWFYVKRNDARVFGCGEREGVTLKPSKDPNDKEMHLSLEDLKAFGNEPFMYALERWVLTRGFGGGLYRLHCVIKKAIRQGEIQKSSMFYNQPFTVAGEPILQPEERWTDPARTAIDAAKTSSGTGGSMDGKVLEAFVDEVRANRISPHQALEEAMAYVEKVDSKAAEKAREAMAGIGDKSFTMMMEMFKFLKEQMTPAPSAALAVQANPAAPAPPQTMKDALKEHLELEDLLDRHRRRNESPENMGETIAKAVTEGIKAVGGNRNGGGGGSRAGFGWVDVLAKIAEPLGPALIPIGTAIAERIRVTQLGGRPAAANQPVVRTALPAAVQQPRPVGNAPTGAPAGAPTPGASAPTATVTPADPSAPAEVVLTPEIVNSVGWMFITRQIVDWITHDLPGDQAAASIYNVFPAAAVNLRTQTLEELTALFSQDPTLMAVKDDPRLTPWLTEFLDYFKPEPDEEEPAKESVN